MHFNLPIATLKSKDISILDTSLIQFAKIYTKPQIALLSLPKPWDWPMDLKKT